MNLTDDELAKRFLRELGDNASDESPRTGP
jgi:hypothetical protein